jgi:antitoxin MazE
MTSEPDTVPSVPRQSEIRGGWTESSKEIADAGDDSLLMGEFGNEDDQEFSW